MKAQFGQFDKSSNWVFGTCGKYNFEAKLFDVGSNFGINNGRVSKLQIWSKGINRKNYIVNYDRGWDIEPSEENLPVYNAVMELLESSPKRFE